MARTPSPWFRTERGQWCVTVRGKHHNLGPHPDGFPAPRKQRGRWNVPDPIQQRFHELMAAPTAAPPAPSRTGLSVAEVFDKFLDWCQKHRTARTFEWYRGHIQSFIDFLPDTLAMPATDLRPYHLIEWADRHPTWGDSHRRGALVAVQRPLNWAARLGYIDASPLWRKVEKPEVRRRENPITPGDFAKILAHVKDQPFRDLLTFAWETGCRPQEVRHIEGRHVRLGEGRIEFPPAEAKGRRRRVIYLSPVAAEIVSRLLAAYPTGKLFRNVDGNGWKVHAVNCRFFRLKTKLGRRFAAYDLRHGFVDRKLAEGVDLLTVSGLLGHKDASMLVKHYEHRSRDDAHLRKAVNWPPAEPLSA